MSHNTSNYRYVLQSALKLSGSEAPVVLDFGCGRGKLLDFAEKSSLPMTVFGADSFEGHYKNWESAPGGRIRKIKDGRIPFDDSTFDVVIANQVFEHIPEPLPALNEIVRVLKPGGVFLALFPTSETWFEGHVGLYFAHWLGGKPQTTYLKCARALGFGYYWQDLDSSAWAARAQDTLETACVYHSTADVYRWWHEVFGAEPECFAADYMIWRIEDHCRLSRLRPLAQSPLGRRILRFICHKRAGRVLAVRKLSDD
ncbi:MAG TPA: class I SAM-dependent methyltransferase [Methyloceanibacter sp.]|nr:class I SAM-dependent methyltransferase [Methyloceanibacter sp.]